MGFLALVLAYIKIRYTIPEYAVQAQIQIVQEKNTTNQLSVFQDLKLGGGGSSQVEDEIEILASRSNFIEVVKELGLNTEIKAVGNILSSEVYGTPPFKINFIAADSLINNAKYGYFIEFTSDNTFAFKEEEDFPSKVYSYGNGIPTPIGDMIITPNVKNPQSLVGKQYTVSVSPVESVARSLKLAVEITPSAEFSNILNITMTSALPQKAKDVIDKLIEVYNGNAIEEKKRVADATSEFINNRIQLISGTLSSVDEDAQELLTQKGMTGSGLEVGAAVQVSAGSRQNLENARVQLQMVSGLKEYVEGETGYEEMPVVDVGNGAISQATMQYNQLVAERKRLLKSADEQNPMIVNLDEQLDGLKSTMQSSLSSLERNVGMNVSTLQSQLGRIQGTIYSAPENQRELRNITRKQETTESLYLYLLQKREESQIAFASAEPKSNIVDRAYVSNPVPVKPKKAITYLAALILGMLVPFGAIYGKDMLDTKIHNKHNLEDITKDVPVLGELPSLGKKDQKLIVKDDRSVLAEALRILRTNLDYLIKSKTSVDNKKNNKIFISSSVPGEGKTFISTNLAMILASTNKKVLLIGADIRNPKFYSFFTGDSIDKMKSGAGNNKDAGLTEFIFNDKIEVKDIINPMLVHHNTIDVIYSGKIPPNPAELLMSSRVGELFNTVSDMYDYVIVDTAPLMVVSDTLLITPYSDFLIYVTRAGVTDKNAIEFPLQLKAEGKLKNLSFVVNDVSLDNLGYGGKYGYGYSKTTKKWWKF
ncbi:MULTISPECIES: GumC family protein [Maribacter]|uniref:non-specific protein-tyrosine kinase n=1 Tax=Maribacter flavus TaxID=1658664 RepID=A0ABU7IJL5_9FLAO|nr:MULTISPECIES: tyrosine-protein kinase family protein [Maribacter]MDC6405699.1 polysaccharide biosynthesis tyrosine autokinase [Maribacter sp. PR66]MEE1973049.1 polysaccharide biosynthesis tyrosine autokinase [Maribacter flavus]